MKGCGELEPDAEGPDGELRRLQEENARLRALLGMDERVLTQRTDHIDLIVAGLDALGVEALVLKGGLGKSPSARGDADPPRHLPASDPMLSDDLEDVEDLGELVELITVDAYGDEGYWSFLQAFEDHVSFPFTASLVGMPVVVTAADFDGDERRGLVVTIKREGTTATISLLDLDLTDAPVPVARLVAAYRRWLGIT